MSQGDKEVSVELLQEFYTHYRINPKTGNEVAGRYVWTPIDPASETIDEVLVCNPPPTEFLLPPESPPSKDKTLAAVGRLVEPNLDEIESLDLTDIGILSLNNVGGKYYAGCTCGTRYDNNCAHFLSNAFVLAGYGDLLTSSLITARCPHKRPIRAQDMLKWFQAKKTGFYGGRVQRSTGWWAVYQETSGWQHVVVIDSTNWLYYGTGDYYDWPTQWNFRIS